MPGLASVPARARGPRVFAVAFETRFFGGRLPAGREVRRTRDFAAMIPVNPTRAPEWHARATGVTATFPIYQPQNYGSPTRRRISAGVAPAARNARKAVALLDLESLFPAASRTSR